MANKARPKPRDVAPDWPDTPSSDRAVEVARVVAVALRAEIAARGERGLERDTGVNRATLRGVAAGEQWPSVQVVTAVEDLLGRDLWPRRVGR